MLQSSRGASGLRPGPQVPTTLETLRKPRIGSGRSPHCPRHTDLGEGGEGPSGLKPQQPTTVVSGLLHRAEDNSRKDHGTNPPTVYLSLRCFWTLSLHPDLEQCCLCAYGAPLGRDMPGLLAWSTVLSALGSASDLIGAKLGTELAKREGQNPLKSCEIEQVGRAS